MKSILRQKSFFLPLLGFFCFFLLGSLFDLHLGYMLCIGNEKIGIVPSLKEGIAYTSVLKRPLASEELSFRMFPCFVKGNAFTNEKTQNETIRRLFGIQINIKEERVTLPFTTDIVSDDTLYLGEEKVLKDGSTGEKIVTFRETIINGKPKMREYIAEKTLTAAITKTVAKGTKPYPSGVGTGKFQYPLAILTVSSSFGTRWGKQHNGIDFAADSGTEILAADSGVVTQSGFVSGFGNLVVIDHKNGFLTYYAHCSALYVKVGETITKGSVIAAVGSTGNSTGPHLHFEIHKNGVVQNPTLFLSM